MATTIMTPISSKESKDNPIPFQETEFGFDYGSAQVSRMHSNPKKGCVILCVKTPKTEIQIYVTKTGKIRLFDKDGEWFKLR